MRVAINGLGRIGRLVLRAAQDIDELEIVAVNDLADPATLAHLLIYDSVHGNFPKVVNHTEHSLLVNNREIKAFSERDPAKLPWKQLKIDVVLESTGFFTTKELASKHLEAGAKKVLLSAPGKGPEPIKTFVMGVNHDTYDPKTDVIISNASCTTNCLAPIVKVLHEEYGIEHGFMLTMHSVTSNQNLVDGPQKDLRRARSAMVNLIPTTTGAAKAVTEVLPQLKGKLDGLAVRVPTPDGSIVDFTATLNKDATVESVNNLMAEMASNGMIGIIEYTDDPIVSSDVIGNPRSAIFDGQMTRVIDNRLIKVLAWYDNEWGYANRTVDLLRLMAKKR